MTSMAETTVASSATSKVKKPVASAAAPTFDSAKYEFPKFEMPKFEMPNFEFPKMEMPAAFRELAEKNVAQAREVYERAKNIAEETTEAMESTYSAASKGYTDYGLKVIATARTNSHAAFDLIGDLLTARSYADVVEKTTTYVRSQFDAVSEQAKDLSEQAQKIYAETARPMTEHFTKVAKAG
jgi:phasin